MTDFTKIKLGLDMLIEKDAYLLQNNLSERSITHKLGEYYQIFFNKWNVDCEYNRNLGGCKIISPDVILLLSQMVDYLEKQQKIIRSKHGINYYSLEYFENLAMQLRDHKRIKYDKELEMHFFLLELLNGETRKMLIYPDIVVHHRGKKDNNIVFEVKKTINLDKIARLYDLVKLATLVSSPEYEYKKGIFIDLPVGNDFNMQHNFKKKKTYFSGVYEYF